MIDANNSKCMILKGIVVFGHNGESASVKRTDTVSPGIKENQPLSSVKYSDRVQGILQCRLGALSEPL